ncbi:hypothetical protein AB0F13_01105 [Streptomyces sp. NPDC026206]|uniref:hypothetical protein n=1 Tax=Streptomyces sp. NPDC026206 TaxID=3157089 RepID=UPI0033FA8D33
MTPHHVTLVHDNWPAKTPDYYASLAAAPPVGFEFSYKTWGYYPGISGSREAPTRFHAIASVVAEVAAAHGVLLNDAGVEKPQEWMGDEHNQQTIAHLLLMAVHRAAYCGLTVDDLTEFLRSTASAHASAGRISDAPVER